MDTSSLTQQIIDGHTYLGYIVAVVVIASVVRAAMQGRAGAEYSDGLAKLAGLLLPLQLVYGLVAYVQASAWDRSWTLAYVHPVVMLAAVALAGISTSKARKAQDAAGSWEAIVRFQGIAVALVIVGIGAASAA